MEQLTFNFGNNDIERLQQKYIDLTIKIINEDLIANAHYSALLEKFYNTVFVYEYFEKKEKLTGDEILDVFVKDVICEYFFLTPRETSALKKIAHEFILNDKFKNALIKKLDKIAVEHEPTSYHVMFSDHNDTYLTTMVDYFKNSHSFTLKI